MSEDFAMKDRKQQHNDPWDESVYGTGRVNPPKNHGGLIAFLLVLVIFMLGLVSAMGFLNVRLFAQLRGTGEPDSNPVDFVAEEATAPTEAMPSVLAPEQLENADSEHACLSLKQSPDSVENVLQEGGLSLQEIYRRSIDSVVSIATVGSTGSSSGTGVIFSSNGYIVTNAHVIEDAVQVTVTLTDGRIFRASAVGSDSASDLAVLRIHGESLPAAEFGDSSALRVGDSVVAIGDPLGEQFRGTMTDGIVSAINRDVETHGRTMTLIQTNAALNPGNSGGPLINCYGQVIGFNTLKIANFTSSSSVEGLGFAIPSTTVKEIVDQLISQGYVSGRPTLGLTGDSISTFYQRYYRIPAGLYVTHLEEGGPARAAGIQQGDIILSIAANRIKSMEDLSNLLYSMEVGDSVEVVLYRSGRQYHTQITLAEAKN